MASSLKSGRFKQNNHSSLANWPDRAPSSRHLRRFLDISPDHLSLGSTAPFGSPSASSDFLHSLTSSHYACCISLCSVQNTTPEDVLSMLVLSHSDAHYLSGVYGRLRVPRNLDSLFYNCPVLDHFPSDFYSNALKFFLFLALRVRVRVSLYR